MVRDIYIGVGADPILDWKVDPYLFYIPPYTTITFLNQIAPALYGGTLHTFQICLDYSPGSGSTAIFNTYTIDGGTPYVITKQHSSGTLSLPVNPTIQTPIIVTLDSQSVPVTAGQYLGVAISNNSASNMYINPFGVEWSDSSFIFAINGNPSSWQYPGGGSRIAGYWMAYGGEGIESGGVSPDACQESAQFSGQGGYNGWAGIVIRGADCTVPPYQVLVDIYLPWGEIEYNKVFVDDIWEQWQKPGSNPLEYYKCRFNLISCLGDGFFQLTECWWRESDTYYVKNGGSDSALGVSWDTAFATISKGATKVPAGGRLYIGHGTYNSETNITPTALGFMPIYYKPVIAGTNGGAGSVTINL